VPRALAVSVVITLPSMAIATGWPGRNLLPGGAFLARCLGGGDQGRDELFRVDGSPAAGDVESGGRGEAGHEDLPGARIGHRVVPADYVGDPVARSPPTYGTVNNSLARFTFLLASNGEGLFSPRTAGALSSVPV